MIVEKTVDAVTGAVVAAADADAAAAAALLLMLLFAVVAVHVAMNNIVPVHTLALAGMIFVLNGTISFSALIIPTISCSSVNSSLAMPSKHFFR